MTDIRPAVPEPERWPAINPRDANSVFEAGLEALDRGDEVRLLPLLDAARAFHPRDARLWQATGLLHRSLDDLAPAVAALEKAAALAPGDAVIAHLYARAALEAGLPSVYLFQRARSLAPLHGAVLLGLAQAVKAEQGAAEAIELIDERLVLSPDWIPGHAWLARLRCVAGQRELVADSFERALETDWQQVALWRELIITLMHAELFEKALEAIGRARQAVGDHPAFDANEAACLDEIGDHEAAARLFAPLAELDDVNLLLRRIRNALRLSRPDQAVALAEPLLASDDAHLVAPYLSIAWRMTEDPRWAWLEGDERLVGVYDLADLLSPLDGLAAQLRALHAGTHQPLEQSVRGGTQTDGNLLSRIEPQIRAVRRAIAHAVEQHVAQLPSHDETHPLLRRNRRALVRFAGSWSIRLPGGGHHANHVHPEGWLSSALYIFIPGENGFGTDQAGWLALGEHCGELGVHLPATRLIEPKPGRLALFPSTMWHRTRPFAAGERLAIAFDVAPPR